MRFYVKNQTHKYTFYTSIDKLRKCTGFTEKEVFSHIELLCKEKVIQTNINKRERWFVDDTLNGKLKSKELIEIVATAAPNIIYDPNGKPKNKPATDHPDDKFVFVDLRLLQEYQNRGFNEKYYPMFCLLNKRQNGTEGKSWQSINNMARDLGFGDATVHNIIKALNQNFLLCSSLRDNGKGGDMYEHRILNNIDGLDAFKGSEFNTYWLKEIMDKNVARWDKLKTKKKKIYSSQEKE